MSLSYLLADDHTIMLNIIEKILCHFESCFSRKAAFRWFVIIITGLMLRSDKLGVTSILRDLALAPGCYDSMLHFFRASSWSLEDIRKRWFSAVRLYAPLYKEGNFHVLVGDGVKQSKEGRRMPGGEEAIPGIREFCKTRIHAWAYVRRAWHTGRELPQLGVHPLKHPAP